MPRAHLVRVPQPSPLPMRALGARPLSDPPGGLLMWIVVALECGAFGLIFVALAVFRGSESEVFRAGQLGLDPTLGLAMTVTLITSGWIVAEAVHAARARNVRRAKRLYAGGIGLGIIFVALKVVDYAAKANAGHGLGVDDFWDAYLLSTAFHFAHVLVGLGLLSFVAIKLGRTPFEDEETAIAGTALFWHMCDLAWFFLFPIFYAGILQ